MTELVLGEPAIRQACDVRLVFELAPELDAKAQAPALAHLNACLEKLCRLGRCGGLRPFVDASFAEYTLRQPCVITTASHAEAVIRLDMANPGIWYLLRNMLESPEDAELHPTMGSAMTSRGALGKPMQLPRLTEDNEEEAYPVLADGLPFQLEFIDRAFRKTRRVLVEFDAEIADSQFAALRDGVRAWAAVLEAGGYAPAGERPSEVDNIMGAIQIFDAWTLEVEVFCFEASEMAWNTLANVVDCYAGQAMKIIRMSVE